MAERLSEHPVTAWARAAVDGNLERPVNRMLRYAAERHLRDLERGHERGLWFDAKAADKALGIFQFLKQRKGRWAGKPLELTPAQVFLVGCLFGWKRADGTRRFRVAFIEVPRKFGKTTLAAALGNLLAWFDNEAGAEVYATATKRDQAKICWDEASWQMANAPAQLKAGIDIRVASLSKPATSSKFLPLGADKDGTDGLNPHGVICDEIHAWKSEEFLGKLETASGAREQPMRVMITTAGTQTSTLYLSEHGYAESVVKGIHEDDSWMVFISCADDPERWQDEEQWYLANPNLGVTVSIDFMRDEYARARVSPSKQSMFKRMYLGIIVSSSEAWLTPEDVDKQVAQIEQPEGELESRTAVVGVDLASIRDVAALVWWFPDEDGDGGVMKTRFYIPEGRVQSRVESDGVPYDAWIEAGYITPTPGMSIDYDFIEEDFKALAEVYQVASVAIDPWQSVQFKTHLEGAGFTVVKVPQSHVRLDACVKEAERLLELGKVRGINPVMRWMLLNAVVSTNAHNERKLDKEKSPEKIDGAVAWLNALSEAMALVTEGPSIYEERGLTIL